MRRLGPVIALLLIQFSVAYAQKASFHLIADKPQNLACQIDSSRQGSLLTWTVTLTNKSTERIAPQSASLSLGIDTYMEKYPFCRKGKGAGKFQEQACRLVGD